MSDRDMGVPSSITFDEPYEVRYLGGGTDVFYPMRVLQANGVEQPLVLTERQAQGLAAGIAAVLNQPVRSVGHPLLRMGTADPGVYECGEECEGDAHFHDPETATYPEPHDLSNEADRHG